MSRIRVTCTPDIPNATVTVRHSFVKSSTQIKHLLLRPLPSTPIMKIHRPGLVLHIRAQKRKSFDHLHFTGSSALFLTAADNDLSAFPHATPCSPSKTIFLRQQQITQGLSAQYQTCSKIITCSAFCGYIHYRLPSGYRYLLK